MKLNYDVFTRMTGFTCIFSYALVTQTLYFS